MEAKIVAFALMTCQKESRIMPGIPIDRSHPAMLDEKSSSISR